MLPLPRRGSRTRCFMIFISDASVVLAKNPPLRPTPMNGPSRSFGSQKSDPFVTRLQRLTQLGQEEISDLRHRNDGALQVQGSNQAGFDARG